MRSRARRVLYWAVSSGYTGMGCERATHEPPMGEPDGGTSLPDAGPANEEPSECPVVPAHTACPSPAPRYPDVTPIFDRRCVVCHSGSPGGPWSLADYGHVAD